MGIGCWAGKNSKLVGTGRNHTTSVCHEIPKYITEIFLDVTKWEIAPHHNGENRFLGTHFPTRGSINTFQGEDGAGWKPQFQRKFDVTNYAMNQLGWLRHLEMPWDIFDIWPLFWLPSCFFFQENTMALEQQPASGLHKWAYKIHLFAAWIWLRQWYKTAAQPHSGNFGRYCDRCESHGMISCSKKRGGLCRIWRRPGFFATLPWLSKAMWWVRNLRMVRVCWEQTR